jgi:hypothetical protein
MKKINEVLGTAVAILFMLVIFLVPIALILALSAVIKFCFGIIFV